MLNVPYRAFLDTGVREEGPERFEFSREGLILGAGYVIALGSVSIRILPEMGPHALPEATYVTQHNTTQHNTGGQRSDLYDADLFLLLCTSTYPMFASKAIARLQPRGGLFPL